MAKKDDLPDFGPVLRRFRQKKGLTQEQLAHLLDYDSATYVGHLEQGVKRPSVDLLFKIANALGVEPEEMIVEMKKEVPGGTE